MQHAPDGRLRSTSGSGPAATDADTVALRLRGVSKAFGNFVALKSTDLDVAKGELVCFLGPSGCGKTTLLRVIAGLEPQSSGTIEIDGRDVTREPPSARDFGIVFQSYALFPNLTVIGNVGYGLVNRSWPRAEITNRVNELLHMVGLEDQGTKYPAQLSGGQQQRVALARAVAASPKLLLLDEPLSALDARVRANLRTEIKALQRRLQITTIFVTHDQEEALTVADRIAVMNRGAIEQIGTPAQVYSEPATPFVAGFIGTMNRLPATMRESATVTLVGVNGPQIRIAPRPGCKPGEPVHLYVRPEAIVLRDVPETAENRLSTIVRDIVFLGSFHRVTLALADAPASTVLVDLSTDDMHALRIAVGATLPIALPVGSLRVFPVAGAGADAAVTSVARR